MWSSVSRTDSGSLSSSKTISSAASKSMCISALGSVGSAQNDATLTGVFVRVQPHGSIFGSFLGCNSQK